MCKFTGKANVSRVAVKEFRRPNPRQRPVDALAMTIMSAKQDCMQKGGPQDILGILGVEVATPATVRRLSFSKTRSHEGTMAPMDRKRCTQQIHMVVSKNRGTPKSSF